MTTAADVKKVVQPLLQRNPDLVLVGRMVVIKPVHHVLRGVYIDRTSAASMFNPLWAAMILFNRWGTFSPHWGDRVYGGFLGLGDTDLADKLCDAIEHEALPVLRPVQSLEDFVMFAGSERFPRGNFNQYPVLSMFVHIALGNLAAARHGCDYISKAAKEDDDPDSDYRRYATEICPLVEAGDRTGLVRRLHDYEEWSVKRMKLEKYWTRTPFPIEASC